jgi:MFS family permease
MIGLNAVFGFTAAFLNSYINGQVVPVALNDPDSKYIGLLSSVVPMVAAAMSLLFGRISPIIGKGPILIFGALCFGGVILPFIVQPDAGEYGWAALIVVYSFHGTGRATFEGTLRATFADYFAYENEGAFANIILQNGIASGVGYIRKSLDYFIVEYCYSLFCIIIQSSLFLLMFSSLNFYLLAIISKFLCSCFFFCPLFIFGGQ